MKSSPSTNPLYDILDVSSEAATVPSYSLLLTVSPKTVIPVTPKGLDAVSYTHLRAHET